MKLLISPVSGIPIYEQIKSQIRRQILSGELKAHTPLPSIRMLAKELKIGIITAKRAYDDLCLEGYTYSVQGKGIYVNEVDRNSAEKFYVEEIKNRLCDIFEYAKENSVSEEKIKILINEILGEKK